MTSTRRGLFRRGRHDGGASAVEYALILAAVALVGAATLFLLGRTVKGAFVAAQNQTASQPSGVLPSVPATSTPGPTTTSPAPTTTSPAPTTSSPAPTTSSPAPTTTSPAPSPTPPRGATTVSRNRTVTVDVGIGGNDRLVGDPTLSPDVGTVSWDRNGNIVFSADRNAPLGPVVITYSYQNNGRGPVITETITIWVVA